MGSISTTTRTFVTFREAAFWAVLGLAGVCRLILPQGDQNAEDGYWARGLPLQFRAVPWGQVTQPAIPLRVIRDGATAFGKRGPGSETWVGSGKFGGIMGCRPDIIRAMMWGGVGFVGEPSD